MTGNEYRCGALRESRPARSTSPCCTAPATNDNFANRHVASAPLAVRHAGRSHSTHSSVRLTVTVPSFLDGFFRFLIHTVTCLRTGSCSIMGHLAQVALRLRNRSHNKFDPACERGARWGHDATEINSELAFSIR